MIVSVETQPATLDRYVTLLGAAENPPAARLDMVSQLCTSVTIWAELHA